MVDSDSERMERFLSWRYTHPTLWKLILALIVVAFIIGGLYVLSANCATGSTNTSCNFFPH